jgi:iron(III) transport system permease protein
LGRGFNKYWRECLLAGAGRTLRTVHVPLIRRGLFAALLLVFVDVMKEMPATLLLRPLSLDTLAMAVWQRTAESLWEEAAVRPWRSSSPG